jgi:mono/diheme cytochrome c family protein
MANRVVVCVFEREGDLLRAAAEARKQGIPIVDAYSPFAIHGLDRAMGLSPSRLPLACLVLGILGATSILAFQYWASTASWAINVGGRPWNSIPAFIPATFEMMVLFGGVGTVITFIVIAGLRTWRQPEVPAPRVTDDRFALVLGGQPTVDKAAIAAAMDRYRPVSVEETDELHKDVGLLPELGAFVRSVINTGLLLVLLLTLGLNWYARRPVTMPNVEYFPDMARTPAFGYYEANPNFADGKTARPPVVGTIARGMPPLEYGPTAADAVRAGNELTNPFSLDDQAAVARGAVVFERYCVPCHGAGGAGDGLIVEHGFRRPPSLVRAFTRNMKDGQLFHIVTYGRGAMPAHGAQIPVSDRWKAVLHVRVLQQAAGAAAPAPAEAKPTGGN